MAEVQAVPVIVVLAASLVSTVTDVWKYKIHNALTLPLLASGLVYHGVWGIGLLNSALGVAFGFGVLLTFYVLGGMGAGDVKLMAAIGAWLGMPLTFYVFLAASLAAGVYAMALLVVGKSLSETWLNLQILWLRLGAVGRHLGGGDRLQTELGRADRRRRMIPFAAMVTVGLVTILIWSWKVGMQ